MSIIPRLAASAGLAALAMAVALPPVQAQPSGGPVRSNACFRVSELDGLKAAGPRTIYARVSGRLYRIGLKNDCEGLGDGSDTPILSPVSDLVCAPLDLNITMRQTRERCIADSIARLSSDEAAALPKSDRP
jgi:hypothetical protein